MLSIDLRKVDTPQAGSPVVIEVQIPAPRLAMLVDPVEPGRYSRVGIRYLTSEPYLLLKGCISDSRPRHK